MPEEVMMFKVFTIMMTEDPELFKKFICRYLQECEKDAHPTNETK